MKKDGVMSHMHVVQEGNLETENCTREVSWCMWSGLATERPRRGWRGEENQRGREESGCEAIKQSPPLSRAEVG